MHALLRVARQFEDFQSAERAGAMLIADSVDELAAKMRLPADIFAEEWRNVEMLKMTWRVDRYGRHFSAEQQLHAAIFRGESHRRALSYARAGS